jgi:hypothetical protein
METDMKFFTVKLKAVCADEMGLFLWAWTPEEALFVEPPMARFSSLTDLKDACLCAGIPCGCWGGPNSADVHKLTAMQLRVLGFKLQQPNLDASRSQPVEHSRQERL